MGYGLSTATILILSRVQYIFANLFTGVVVESFYYVFQMSGGAKSITREEMRAFKKVWAEFANPKTGYLERHNFVRFFGVCLSNSYASCSANFVYRN